MDESAALSWQKDLLRWRWPSSIVKENIVLKKDFENASGANGEELTCEDQDIVSMMLYVKDKYNVSGSAYHEMASICGQMPRQYCLKQNISELNTNGAFTLLWRELKEYNNPW